MTFLKLCIYLQGKLIVEPHQIIVRTRQLYLNTHKETITMLSMGNFIVLATLLVFIFRVIVPLLPSDEQNKIFPNKFDKTRQREFWNLMKIWQIIVLAISCHFIYSFSFIFYLCISFWRVCKYNFKVWDTLTQLYHNAINFPRHKWNLNNS